MKTPAKSEFEVLSDWVAPGSRVLDLGCGDGELLARLQHRRQATGYGLEIDPASIQRCLERGIDVIEQDLNAGLENFASASFDFVLLTNSVQELVRPDRVIGEMLRIGRKCLVTFPNFAHWRLRLHLARRGRMPVSVALPHQWYDTPNIHLCTLADFETFCAGQRIRVLGRRVLGARWATRLWPNLFGERAIYLIERHSEQ